MNQKYKTAEATLSLGPVLTTSRIMALMELAATRLVQQGLRGAQSSVGVAMNVTHAAPALAAGSLSGASVRAVASLRGVEGRLHHIAIDAFDESGLIASAEHTRVIVDGRVGRSVPAVTLEA
jgi:fluoroacetyl-CoA thioesterase